ncbi:MAG: hypothetical protein C5S47_03930 [Candidatus Methanogasteraceae archaeon]|nr:MAG: hypothetical protein C5S47_03930 [ANME-2 cluster archaeon]
MIDVGTRDYYTRVGYCHRPQKPSELVIVVTHNRSLQKSEKVLALANYQRAIKRFWFCRFLWSLSVAFTCVWPRAPLCVSAPLR